MAKKANSEGSIYRRKVDGMYVGSITLEDGKRKYFYSKKRQDVAEKMNAALLEKKQGTLVAAPQRGSKRTPTRSTFCSSAGDWLAAW